MINKKLMSGVFAAALLFGAANVWAAEKAAWPQAVEAAAAREVQKANTRVEIDRLLARVNARWERCDVLQRSVRMRMGQKLRLIKPWTCKTLEVNCEAVHAGDKVLVPAACFMPETSKDQTLVFKGGRMTLQGGASFALEHLQSGQTADFSYFLLPASK